MTMPGRNYEANENSSYRYGYNTQEKSTENCGCGNTYSAQFWEYDARLGRRYNIDPVEDYGVSPYATNRNNPIIYSDPKGDCPFCIGFVVGALAEIVEQTVSNGIKNLVKGKGIEGFFDDLTIDWADVAVSGMQGAISGGTSAFMKKSATALERVALWGIIENTGNMAKSAVDVKFDGENGALNSYSIFDGTKSIADFEQDFMVNSVGSAGGGLLSVPSVMTGGLMKSGEKASFSWSYIKSQGKKTIVETVKESPKAMYEGTRTGIYEGVTDASINRAKENNKQNASSSSNINSNTQNTSKSTKKTPPPKSNTRRTNPDVQKFIDAMTGSGVKVNSIKTNKDNNGYSFEVTGKNGKKVTGGYTRNSTDLKELVKYANGKNG
jgi:hypothetical protein